MNHVLPYTQLKFKLDPFMKPEILGSIPSGVANLWTLTRSTRMARLAIFFKKKVVWNGMEKWFSSFEGEKLSKNENP